MAQLESRRTASLSAGLRFEFSYRVPEQKTVPYVYPESALFQAMPHVFATAYLVGLFEWACMEAMQPHLEPGEQSLGVDVQRVVIQPERFLQKMAQKMAQ